MAFQLVYVVLEPPLARALAAAARRAAAQAGVGVAARGFLLHELADPARRAELAGALATADVLLGGVLNLDAEVRALAELLQARRPPVTAIFHSQLEALLQTHIGDFDGRTFRQDGTMGRVLGALREKGVPLPGLPNVVLAALPQLVHLLPPDQFGGLKAYAAAARLWGEGTEGALAALILHLLNQHPAVAGRLTVPRVAPLPQVALWHPQAGQAFATLADYEAWYRAPAGGAGASPPAGGAGASPGRQPAAPAVGVLLHRRWVAAGDTAHYAAVIGALEAEGLAVYPAFSDLDVTPLVEQVWRPAGVQALVNLTAFNLVGGHGRPSPERAVAALQALDVPYLAPVPVLFQSLEQWRAGQRGLTAPQLIMQVVMPELEGGAEPWPYAGTGPDGAMAPEPAAVARLARRVRRWVDLRLKPPAERKVAITLFSNPPGKGALGTAAYLDVFRSLHRLLLALRAGGYTVEVPADHEELLRLCVGGTEARYGSGDLPLAARVRVAEYRRWVPGWRRIERCWGKPPGELDTDGRDLLVFGRRFGNVFVGLQPAFGYEGDPLRLLLNPEFAPSHAFAAYYAWLQHGWGADAVVHFGTHGALEFMPGKQAGLAPEDWPAALIGDLPHLYLYAVNNPSEAAIAKRRGGAVTVGYRTPPLARAGLYRTLADLQETLRAYWAAEGETTRAGALQALRALAEQAHLDQEVPPEGDDYPERLDAYLQALAARHIPVGLRVVGEPASPAEVEELLRAAAAVERPEWAASPPGEAEVAAVLAGAAEPAPLAALRDGIRAGEELPQLLRALDGRYIAPGPGGDPLRNPAVLPAGRNLHALDPWKIPTKAAWQAGALAGQRLLERLAAAGEPLPEAVAVVLWGSDNIKTGGEGIAQALWLMGAEPVADSLGRITRVRLIPLEQLGRPRIDVVATCSGIFRDLFPGTMGLLQEAALLAATAEEPPEMNHVRRHALEQAAELGIPVAEAAQRVFAAQSGLYGTGVNQAVGEGAWESTLDLAELYVERMGYAAGPGGEARDARRVLRGALRRARVTLQNIDSTEVSLADIDHYFEHLGGLSAAVAAARGSAPLHFVVDGTTGRTEVRSLREALRLEVRTRLLNPRWYEGMLKHGFQGVNEVAVRLENTYGWLATTGQVDGWALDAAADTFVLDPAMRDRLAGLNPRAAARMAARLVEAAERGLWAPSPEREAALRAALEELEDRVEGVGATA